MVDVDCFWNYVGICGRFGVLWSEGLGECDWFELEVDDGFGWCFGFGGMCVCL